MTGGRGRGVGESGKARGGHRGHSRGGGAQRGLSRGRGRRQSEQHVTSESQQVDEDASTPVQLAEGASLGSPSSLSGGSRSTPQRRDEAATAMAGTSIAAHRTGATSDVGSSKRGSKGKGKSTTIKDQKTALRNILETRDEDQLQRLGEVALQAGQDKWRRDQARTHVDPIDEVTRRLEKLPLEPRMNATTGEIELEHHNPRTGNERRTYGYSGESSRAEDPDQHDAVSQIYDAPLLGPAYFPAEDTIRNDYSQYFVDTRGLHLPGSAVRNSDLETRFEEYPKLRRLIERKEDILSHTSHPPTYLPADLLPSLSPSRPMHFHLADLAPVKYDVVIIDPPLQAYERGNPSGKANTPGGTWTWEQVAALPIPQIVARESFVFLWVGPGSSDGLEKGREVLSRWGFRRCEDIVWVQTNGGKGGSRSKQVPSSSATSGSPFVGTTQHCLMGIRGTVRRSTDTRFVHCNIDTDVILWKGEPADDTDSSQAIDPRSKPVELMDIAENFCLGTRRLELFGRNRNLRRGWLTVGLDVGPDRPGWSHALSCTNSCAAKTTDGRARPQAYNHVQYSSNFRVDSLSCPLLQRGNLVPFDQEVEELRPRSPQRRNAPLSPADAGAHAALPSIPQSIPGPVPAYAIMPVPMQQHQPIPARPNVFAGTPIPPPYQQFRPPHTHHGNMGFMSLPSPGYAMPAMYGMPGPAPFNVPQGLPPQVPFAHAPQYGYNVQPMPIHFHGLAQPPASQFPGVGTGGPPASIHMANARGPSTRPGPPGNIARPHASHHQHAGGAGLSGLGAGGPSVVSRQSGSELLSGAQASVMLGMRDGGGGSGGSVAHSARHSPTHRQQQSQSNVPSSPQRPR